MDELEKDDALIIIKPPFTQEEQGFLFDVLQELEKGTYLAFWIFKVHHRRIKGSNTLDVIPDSDDAVDSLRKERKSLVLRVSGDWIIEEV